MNGSGHPFLALLRVPHARSLAASGLVARLREAGSGLAIVLAARHLTGSYATAGLAVAVYLLGAATTRPLHGRLIDRRGPRALLIPSAVNAALIGGLGVAVGVGPAGAGGAREGVLFAFAAAIGITLPAISATIRATWPRLAGERTDAAYAFDTVLYELSLIASPAIVGLLATGVAPWAGLALVAVAGALGTTALALIAPRAGAGAVAVAVAGEPMGGSATSSASPGLPCRSLSPPESDRHGTASRADDVSQAPGHAGRRRASAPLGLRTRAVGGLVAVAAFTGLAEGTLTVVVPAYGSSHGGGALGGLLLSALSVGSLVGATVTGTVRPPADWRGRLVLTTAALTAAFILLAAVSAGPVGTGALLALAGAALAPTLTAGFVALQREVPPGALTEAFTWASFAAAAGAAGGQALAGQLVAGPGARIALWEPAAAAAVALGLAAALLRSRPRPA